MSRAVQRRRGTHAQTAAFTGLSGEITVDVTEDRAVVHDGATAGGHPLAKLKEVQAVTAETEQAISEMAQATAQVITNFRQSVDATINEIKDKIRDDLSVQATETQLGRVYLPTLTELKSGKPDEDREELSIVLPLKVATQIGVDRPMLTYATAATMYLLMSGAAQAVPTATASLASPLTAPADIEDMVVEFHTESTTIIAAKTALALVYIQGGGASGGGSTGAYTGGGGSSGEFGLGVIHVVQGQPIDIVVGAGGARPSAQASGKAGGASSVTSQDETISVLGGKQGVYGNPGTGGAAPAFWSNKGTNGKSATGSSNRGPGGAAPFNFWGNVTDTPHGDGGRGGENSVAGYEGYDGCVLIVY